MKLLVGLGNPGIEYERTRHNVGFEVLDRVARRTVDPSRSIARSRFSGALLEGEVAPEKGGPRDAEPTRLLLLKPLTYMNRSGQAVAEAVRFHKLDPTEDLLVVVDDLALPCGTIRLKPDGSAGGHNGLADIEQKLGSNRYPRLRIGIDAPGPVPQADYVLGRFRPDQQPLVEAALEQAVEACLAWARSGLASTMNRFNATAKASP